MQIKSVLMALSVIATLTLGNGDVTAAKSQTTDKKNNKSSAQKVEKKTKKVIVKVKSGDTLEKIAKRNKTTYVKLFNANPSISDPDLIDVGDKIRIPTKGEKLPNRFAKLQAQVATAVSTAPLASASVDTETAATYTTQNYTSAPVNSSSYYVGNGMWCTDYVHSKRPDVSIYRNAGMSWMSAAQSEGKATGSTPKAGAVAVTNGHVAYVEKVNGDGSYVVSEMGWNYQAGNYNKRTVQAGAFGGFIY